MDGGDWRRAAGAGAAVGVLFVADETVDGVARRQRSRFTDRVSGATTSLGGATEFRIPAVLLVSGIVFSDANLRDIPRAAISAPIHGLARTSTKRSDAANDVEQ
ncbi:MAG: hypothetical protein LC796_00175 [Acidobacteria bacterium]|nr:hypothetical protein [Acidobacteriota bacterium]MCA1609418.1 hypothetical protein [Acidobacteriota bacterium]